MEALLTEVKRKANSRSDRLVGWYDHPPLAGKGRKVRILVHRSLRGEVGRQGLTAAAQSLIEAGARPVNDDPKDRASMDIVKMCIETSAF